MSWGYGFRPYVPVARRQANAKARAAKLAKKEKRALAPIELAGKAIAASHWGKAWCDNLEQYSDYENRLPRGRSYVRNGSVIDLQIKRGAIKALVSGSSLYEVNINIKTVQATSWLQIKKDCSRSIDSLIDLLQGRFDRSIMERLSCKGGLFPEPSEIKMSCSCPDWADMCKHIAAVLYGVGARLDASPEMLFSLRAVDHFELISEAANADNLSQAVEGKKQTALSESDLGEIFGIEIESNEQPAAPPAKAAAKRPRAQPKPAKPDVSASAKKPKKAAASKKPKKAVARR